jgi:hypothetical protein
VTDYHCGCGCGCGCEYDDGRVLMTAKDFCWRLRYGWDYGSVPTTSYCHHRCHRSMV